MNIKLLITLAIATTVIASAIANDGGKLPTPRKTYISINTHQGSMLKTVENTILQNYYVGLDFRLGWQTDDSDKNIFDASYRYPYYGIGYYMGNMNGIILNTDIDDLETSLGKPAAVYAFFGSPMYRSKYLLASYNIGLGFSYNFNTYHPEDNPLNLFIGSKNNAYIDLSTTVSLNLPGHSSLSAGIGFLHFSNGSYQKPNKGVNLVSGTLAYQFNTYKNKDKSYSNMALPAWDRTWEWYVFMGNGVRMLDADYDPNYPKEGHRWYCATLSSAALVQTSHRRKLGIGMDLFYFDWGKYVVNYRALSSQQEANGRYSDNFALGLYLAHEVGYKRVWLITHLGFYPTDRVGDRPQKPTYYERVGVKFDITNRLFASLSIKAHGAKADYTEWSIGYSLIKNKPIHKNLP